MVEEVAADGIGCWRPGSHVVARCSVDGEF